MGGSQEMLRGIPVAWADAATGSDVLRMSAIGGLTSRRYRISSGRQKELRSRGQGSTAGICMEREAQRNWRYTRSARWRYTVAAWQGKRQHRQKVLASQVRPCPLLTGLAA